MIFFKYLGIFTKNIMNFYREINRNRNTSLKVWVANWATSIVDHKRSWIYNKRRQNAFDAEEKFLKLINETRTPQTMSPLAITPMSITCPIGVHCHRQWQNRLVTHYVLINSSIYYSLNKELRSTGINQHHKVCSSWTHPSLRYLPFWKHSLTDRPRVQFT